MEELIGSLADFIGLSTGLVTLLVVILCCTTLGYFTLRVSGSFTALLVSQAGVLLVFCFIGLLPLWGTILVIFLVPTLVLLSRYILDWERKSHTNCPECGSQSIKHVDQKEAPNFWECKDCGTGFLTK